MVKKDLPSLIMFSSKNYFKMKVFLFASL